MRDQGLSDGPLSSIRILDLADEKAAFCSKLLADMGADVIKIEKPGGDRSRKIGPFCKGRSGPEKSISFWYQNANKRGITLDLESKAGRDILYRLIRRTDVLVESFDPARLEELELDFKVLSGLNPRLIVVSVTGFGLSGPRKDYKSCDLLASAFGGQMSVTGSPDTPPLKAHGELSYYTASLHAAIGVLLALRKRAGSGKGTQIDISLQEAVTSTLDHVMVRYFHDNVIAQRQGARHWDHAFYVLPCRDGYVLLSPFLQWETLVWWLDSEGMAGDLKDERFNDLEYRFEHADLVVETLQRWTETHTRQELFEEGQLRRFPWAPVCSPREVSDSPQLKGRSFFNEIHHPEIGAGVAYPGQPYQSSLSYSRPSKRAPLVGENNIEIYQGELGLSDEELERLASDHVI